MRKSLIVFSFLICFGGFLLAQKLYIADYPDKLFDEGRKMYSDENYVACIEKMQAYKEIATNDELIKQADYYIVSSSFARNNLDTPILISDFLQNHPSSEYENRLNFLMASLSFRENNYLEAIEWFHKSDMLLLSKGEQEDYSYCYAYCLLQADKPKEAFPFFAVLSASGKGKYYSPATYYTGYIHFLLEEYDKALTKFSALQKDPEYNVYAGFYITQIEFIRQQYDDVIYSGEKLLKNNNLSIEHRLETQRVVGESFYHKGDLFQATRYLEPYVNNSSSPLRSSYYMLGAAYFRQADFTNAVKNLNKVRTDDDLIAQNTYLLLGQSYLQLHDKRNARMAFESAANMDFDKDIQEVAMFNCGLLTHEISYSAFGESVFIFERFLNMFPDSKYTDQVNDCLVETYFSTRNYQAALSSIEKIKQPTRKILEAKQNVLFQIGIQHFANNDFQKAIQQFTQSLQVGNYSTEIKALNYFWRGESYYRLNQFKSATADYESYLAQTTKQDKDTYASALYNLGYAYFKQQNYTAALTHFSRYVSAELKDRKSVV